MLFDTDVLIWVLRGNVRAAKAVEDASDRLVSVVTCMELLQGARNRREAQTIKAFVVECGFLVVPLSENIGHRAMIYMEEYALKGGMRVADALVAATAVENHCPLMTANQRHYRQINELELKLFRP